MVKYTTETIKTWKYDIFHSDNLRMPMSSLETDESGPALPCDWLATARAPERISIVIIEISDGSNDDHIDINDGFNDDHLYQ